MKRDLQWDLTATGQISRPAFAISTFITYEPLENVPYFSVYPLPNKNLNKVDDISETYFHNFTITGPKTVFLLLDLKLTFENKMDVIKQAIKKSIDALSEYDYFMFISFTDTAVSQGNTLLPMTIANKSIFKTYIDELSLSNTLVTSDLDLAIAEM